MHFPRSRAVAAILLLLGTPGCVVLSSRYDEKTREADSLRDAIALTNRERAAVAARNEALQKDLDEERKRSESCQALAREQEAAIRKSGEELAAARKSYEGTRITREQLVNELLEKEKATGKRMQELGAKVLQCDADRERLRKEAEAREKETAELRRKADRPSAEEDLRRERDILLGRVERLTEEKRQDDRRRDERFDALAKALAKAAPGAESSVSGPVFRVAIPERALSGTGPSRLSDAAVAAVLEVGRAASELPSATIVVSAGSRRTADEIRSLLAAKGAIAERRIAAAARDGERGAELLLVVP